MVLTPSLKSIWIASEIERFSDFAILVICSFVFEPISTVRGILCGDINFLVALTPVKNFSLFYEMTLLR